MTKPSSPRQRPHVRLRAVPPVAHRIGVCAFSGFEILEEYDGAPGFLLWVSFRDAELWTTGGERRHLIHHSSPELASRTQSVADMEDGAYGPIKPALLTLAQLSVDDPPDVADVASGCEVIAGWSEMQSRLGTAVEYAQVASFALPDRAICAVRAARVLRMRAEYERALTWFDHGIVTARRTADWESYAQAYSGVGCLYMQRGNFPRARVMLLRSLRTALRHNLPERIGAAYHNLFAVEASTGNWEVAERNAESALTAYPEGSRGRPRLARDLAFRWIQRGYFERALPLAREVLPHFAVAADRALDLVLSDIARAAAGCGEVESFEDAWAQAYAIWRQDNVEPFTVDILINLAHAAASRGDTVRGQMTANRAAEIARERKQGESRLEAEALLSALRSNAGAVAFQQRSPDDLGKPEIVNKFVTALRLRGAAAV